MFIWILKTLHLIIIESLSRPSGSGLWVLLFHILKNLTRKIPFKDSSAVDKSVQVEDALGIKDMVVLISAGILSALRRVIARRVSLKVFFSPLWNIAFCTACLLEFLLFCFVHPESAEKKTSCNNSCFCHLLPLSFCHVGCHISKLYYAFYSYNCIYVIPRLTCNICFWEVLSCLSSAVWSAVLIKKRKKKEAGHDEVFWSFLFRT